MPKKIVLSRSLSRALLLSAATLLFAAPAFADTIAFSIANPTKTSIAGSTVSFSGTVTVTGNTSPVYLDDSYTVDPLTTLSDGGYFNNIFPVAFNSGDSLTALLFTITLPANLVAGTYGGTFTLYEDNDPTVFSTQNYQVIIPASTSPVPEPSTWALLATGLAIGGAAFTLNGRRTRTASHFA